MSSGRSQSNGVRHVQIVTSASSSARSASAWQCVTGTELRAPIQTTSPDLTIRIASAGDMSLSATCCCQSIVASIAIGSSPGCHRRPVPAQGIACQRAHQGSPAATDPAGQVCRPLS